MQTKSIMLVLLAIMLSAVSCTKKVSVQNELFVASTADVKGYDPIFADDLYSGTEMSRVYEGLLQFHYLKRPYVLEPALAQSLPEVSSDGLTYTFKIKKGILFHDSPAFPGGKGREVVANDFVYSIKRLADPKLQSTGWWLLDGKIAGLNEWRKKYSGAPKVSYADDIVGLKALDKYTLQFKLSKPFPQFLYALAMPFTYVVAKEAVEHFGKEFVNHPVGTGPFVLPKYDRSKKIVYTKNPAFRDEFYPSEGEAGDKENGLLSDAGKKLPLSDKITVNIITEAQPRWLNFQRCKIDVLAIPKDNFDQAVTGDKGLAKEFLEKGMILDITPGLDVTFMAFNFDNDLFKDNVNLRRAISLAYDVSESNRLF